MAGYFSVSTGEYVGLLRPRQPSLTASVIALVHSYVDWVDEQPGWAQFVLQARSVVSTGALKDELALRNRQRNKKLFMWMTERGGANELAHIPAELLPSLIIGQSESYSRAWLSKRVENSPKRYRDLLARAAWDSIVKLEPHGE